MELKQYVRLLWRWSWAIALLMGLAGSAAYILSNRATPVYEASTTLMISQTAANGATVDLNALRTSEELAGTYVALLRKRPIMEAVNANLKLDVTPEQLAKKVSVGLVSNTQLIVVTARDSNPQLAADIANEVVRVFSQQNRELQASRYAATKQNLEQELSQIQSNIDITQAKLDAVATAATPEEKTQRNQLRLLVDQQRSTYTTVLKSYEQVRITAAQTIDNLNVVEPARPESSPISPKTSLNIVLAALVAAMISLGVLYVLGYLDNSVKSSEELERLIDVPTLASIPRIPGSQSSEKLIVAIDSKSPIAETYRMLRTNIDFATIDQPIHTIVVTSSKPGEGKSITAANLGVALAQTGKRVILVDADLRRPTLHKYFDQTNTYGLTTALLRNRDEALDAHLSQTNVPNLYMMPSGPLPPNPAELLGSQRMVTLIEELSLIADVVMFDSPPLLAVVDGALLSHICDATLLVALAGTTGAEMVRSSKDQLVRSNARLLGTVFNQVSAAHGGYYQAYYSIEGPRRRRFGWRRTKNIPGRGYNGTELAGSASQQTLGVAMSNGHNGNGHAPAEMMPVYETEAAMAGITTGYDHNGHGHSLDETVELYAVATHHEQVGGDHNGHAANEKGVLYTNGATLAHQNGAGARKPASNGKPPRNASEAKPPTMGMIKRITQSKKHAKRAGRKF